MNDGWACFSKRAKYRYLLGRRISDSPGRLLFIMLNPSMADEKKSDPTISKCIEIASASGFGELEVVNLYAFRAPKQTDLWQEKRPKGKDNDRYIRKSLKSADRVILAWGSSIGQSKKRKKRAGKIMRMVIKATRKRPYHLGLNQNGEPKHPKQRVATTPHPKNGQSPKLQNTYEGTPDILSYTHPVYPVHPC